MRKISRWGKTNVTEEEGEIRFNDTLNHQSGSSSTQLLVNNNVFNILSERANGQRRPFVRLFGRWGKKSVALWEISSATLRLAGRR